jgi:hypothetical protein
VDGDVTGLPVDPPIAPPVRGGFDTGGDALLAAAWAAAKPEDGTGEVGASVDEPMAGRPNADTGFIGATLLLLLLLLLLNGEEDEEDEELEVDAEFVGIEPLTGDV